MPPLPGEERLLTLFVDVHYYFSKPTSRPLRHRFDKASYFYIYYNSTRHTCRIEIANNPGTTDQDAVHGYIDKSHVTNSSRFPTRVTLEVEIENAASSPASPLSKDIDEWRLWNGDLRDASREKSKVHTVDLYFWTQGDAQLTVDFFRKLLVPAQLDLGKVPSTQGTPQAARKQDAVSSVVKNLENAAINDPAYQNGQTMSSQSQPQGNPVIPVKLPPPPATSPMHQSSSAMSSHTVSEVSQRTHTTSPSAQQDTTQFTPMAYNPAAPAAPEPIAHREKTPPPEDGGEGTGLATAAHEPGHYTAHSHQSYSQQSWGSPPPPSTQPSQHGSPPPPPSIQPSHYGSPPLDSMIRSSLSQTSSLGYASPPPAASGHYGQSTTPSTAPSHNAPGADTAHASHRTSSAAQHYTPNNPNYHQQQAQTPGEGFYNSLPSDRKPLQHVQPRYPAEYFSPTGSSAYPLQSQQAPDSQHPQTGQGHDYNIHSSVYRPTEAEMNTYGNHRPSKPSQRNDGGGSLKGFAKRFTSGVNKTIQKAENHKYL